MHEGERKKKVNEMVGPGKWLKKRRDWAGSGERNRVGEGSEIEKQRVGRGAGEGRRQMGGSCEPSTHARDEY